jgi:hypothetical protein
MAKFEERHALGVLPMQDVKLRNSNLRVCGCFFCFVLLCYFIGLLVGRDLLKKDGKN